MLKPSTKRFEKYCRKLILLNYSTYITINYYVSTFFLAKLGKAYKNNFFEGNEEGFKKHFISDFIS